MASDKAELVVVLVLELLVLFKVFFINSRGTADALRLINSLSSNTITKPKD